MTAYRALHHGQAVTIVPPTSNHITQGVSYPSSNGLGTLLNLRSADDTLTVCMKSSTLSSLLETLYNTKVRKHGNSIA